MNAPIITLILASLNPVVSAQTHPFVTNHEVTWYAPGTNEHVSMLPGNEEPLNGEMIPTVLISILATSSGGKNWQSAGFGRLRLS
jgi:hypothetical protein